MTEQTEKLIAKGEVIKISYQQKKGGTFVTFMLNEGPDDNFEQLVKLPLGEVITLEITQPDIGA